MNGLVHSSLKLTVTLNYNILNTFRQKVKLQEISVGRFYSTFWKICMRPTVKNAPMRATLWNKSSCMVNHYSTDGNIIDLMDACIQVIERRLPLTNTISTNIDGFDVELNGLEIYLVREIHNTIDITTERIVVNFSMKEFEERNVFDLFDECPLKNHFTVEITLNDQTLKFQCIFFPNECVSEKDTHYDEFFIVDTVVLYVPKKTPIWLNGKIQPCCDMLYKICVHLLTFSGITKDLISKVEEVSILHKKKLYSYLLQNQ